MLASLLTSLGFSGGLPTITREDLKRHCTEQSLLILAGDDVFDVTDYLDDHPGGRETLLRRGGGAADCTRDLNFHSSKARRQWKDHRVAVLGKKTTLVTRLDKPPAAVAAANAAPAATPAVMVEAPTGEAVQCSCSCHEQREPAKVTSETQTRCCREGTGLPTCTADPAARSVCVWRSSGEGVVVMPIRRKGPLSDAGGSPSTPTLVSEDATAE